MRNILALLLCLTFSDALAQTLPASFFRVYKESGYNTGISSIQQTSDGGYIAIGSAISTSNSYVIVVKLDAAGRITWQNNYVASGQVTTGSSIRQTSSGYIALTGLGPDTQAQTLLVMSLSSDGALVWQQTYPAGPDGVLPYSIEPTADGGYLVSALQFAATPFVDPLLGLKLDSTGAIVWQKVFATYNSGSLHATSDGGAIVAGSPNTTSTYSGRVLKLDPAGNSQWDRSYSLGVHDAFFSSARQTPDGGYIVSGYYFTKGNSGANSNALLMKLDAEGDISATYAYSSSSCPSEGAGDAQNAPGGGYYLILGYCGHFNGIAKLDASGDILWQRMPVDSITGISLTEIAFSPTNDGGYVAAGSVGNLQVPPQMVVVKASSSGALPACAEDGTPDLLTATPPQPVVTSKTGPTANTSITPVPVTVTAAPAQLTLAVTCEP